MEFKHRLRRCEAFAYVVRSRWCSWQGLVVPCGAPLGCKTAVNKFPNELEQCVCIDASRLEEFSIDLLNFYRRMKPGLPLGNPGRAPGVLGTPGEVILSSENPIQMN